MKKEILPHEFGVSVWSSKPVHRLGKRSGYGKDSTTTDVDMANQHTRTCAN